MKKHQSIIPKKISLSALGILSALSSVAAIALINSPENSRQQLLKAIAPTITSTTNQINRNITDNVTNSQDVRNPDEVFYTEQDLTTKDVWDATNKTENAANKKFFENFKKNLENATGNSPLKEELAKVTEETDKYINYKKAEDEYSKSGLQDLVPWENIKEEFKAQLGNPKENFAEIEQLATIQTSMAQLSGLTDENQPVSSIKQLVASSLKSNNLTAENNNQANLTGVDQVAGTGYTSLVKIAEIDLSQLQNFILDYTYQVNSAANEAKGHLIIKNDKGQIKDAANLQEAYNKLDIFGRYEPLPKGVTIGSNSHPEKQQNIVLRKEAGNDTLTILARLKGTEILKNISFATTETGQPTKFGILDVQANDKTTFRKVIENRNTTTVSDKLMDDANKDANSANQLVAIQFFSSEFLSQKITAANPAPFALDPKANRFIQVYQGIETVPNNGGGTNPDEQENVNLLSLDLNYVTRFAEDGADNDYEPIKEYVAGVATNKTISIDLAFDGTKPTQINDQENSTYNFFALLKDTMDKEILKLFPEVSQITVRSSVDPTNKIAKQEVGYSDLFYLIGNPSTKVGIDNTKELVNKIPDLTRKIFAEKPEQFNDPTPPQQPPFRSKRQAQPNNVATSTIKANEQIDEKVNVIQTLGAVYDKWQQNDPDFNQTSYTINVPKVEFEQKGAEYNNITINRKEISGTGPQLIDNQVGLDKYWRGVANLITTKFNPQFQGNQNRFTYNATNNTGLTIVEKWLVNNFEFIPNYANVDAILSEGIKLWNDDPATSTSTGNPPTLNQLKPETQRSFAALLAKLIEIQYEAIVKEFESNQMFPIYKSFQNLLNVETQTSRSVVGDVANIVQSQSINAGGTTLSLIQYQTNGWDNVFSQTQSTLKNQLLSLINLLRFGGTDDDRTLLADAILTNPVIALKFKEFSAENLVNFVDSQPFSTKLNQLRILDGILSYFGYSFIDSYTEHINSGGTADNFKLTFKVNGQPSSLTFEQVLEEIINKLVAKTNEYKPTANEQYQSIWLDNIIAGTNVIRSMNWKLRQLNNVNPTPPLQRNISLYADEPQFSSQDLIKKINDILGQQQGSPAEQAAWQGAINNGSKRFDQFSEFFSGRGGAENVEKIFNAITQDKAIMERRTIDFNEGYLVSLTESLKYIWFIILALIGVGVMAASSIGIATKSKQAQLSKHPIIKWVLFSLIGLGLLTAVLALVFGLPAVL